MHTSPTEPFQTLQSLDQKSPQAALVTGASSGIGRQIAVQLGTLGYSVVIDHFRDEDGARRTLQLVEQAGGSGWIHDADVGCAQELDILFEQIVSRDVPLSVLINNAAFQTFAPLIDLSEEDWNRTIRTNLTGTFLCTQRAARLMRGSGGSIINIGSGANKIPFPKLGSYCASKGGIEMLTKVAAIELGEFNVRVNCIAPGAIENERTRSESPEYGDTWAAVTPLGRVGTESDVSQAVALLLSPQSGFITGQTLYVDGGLWTRGVWPYD